MKNIIFLVIKRIAMAICILYAFDIIAGGLQVFLPINVISISIISLLGISGLLSLIAIYFVLL